MLPLLTSPSMDAPPEVKPNPSLEHHRLLQRAAAAAGGLPTSSSMHMSLNGIHLRLPEPPFAQQQPNPIYSNTLPGVSLHYAIAGGNPLQLMAHAENSVQNLWDGPFNSGGMAIDSPLHLSDIATKDEENALISLQQFKRRRDGDGSKTCNGSSQLPFPSPPSLGNSSLNIPINPPLHQTAQNSHRSLHHSVHLPQQSSKGSFQSLTPFQGSPKSPIQKPIANLQGVQAFPQNPQQNSLNAYQTMQSPPPTSAFQNLQSPLASALYGPSQASDVRDRRLAVQSWGNRPLSEVDPQLWEVMEREKNRQWRGIELIASENFTSQAVIEALGSHLTNKYSEGMPGARYYGGNEFIDQIENLCCERALAAFHLDPNSWGVNVQPYSCTSANLAVYTALLQPKDRIMGLDSPSGGHLSHGYYTSSGKKVSAASIFFESLAYRVNPHTGLIDFEKLEEKALDFRPKILICGGSAYPREWDYERFRRIADKCGAILMCDMAHVSGLIAAQECASPFDYCDVVTSTTHKSLRGPRGGMIFYRKGLKHRRHSSPLYGADDTGQYDFEERICFAVFPSLQGGPHNNHIAALAVALKQVATSEYKAYVQQVKKNAQALAEALQRRGCKLVTNGTDNHLLLWDLRPHGLTGKCFEKICELCLLTLNKNAVFGDNGALAPGGVRIGTPAMTSRGCLEGDFEVIAEFLLAALQIAINVKRENGKLQKEFLKGLHNNKEIDELRNSIQRFAASFGMPGFATSNMRYNQ